MFSVTKLKQWRQITERNAPRRQLRQYKIFLIVFLLLIAIFCTSGFWMPDTSKILNTSFGTKQNTSDSVALTLEDWQYNPKTGYMETTFDVTLNNTVYTESMKYRYELYSDNSQNTPLNCKLVYSDENTVVFQIRNLPQGWKVLSLRIGDNTQDLQNALSGTVSSASSNTKHTWFSIVKDDKTPARFNCDVRAVKTNSTLKPRDTTSYAEDSIQHNVAKQNTEIDRANIQIKANLSTIDMLKKDIASIQKEQVYQTASDVEQSASAIQDKQSQIDSLQEKNNDLQDEIALCKEKIDKLNLKLGSVKGG